MAIADKLGLDPFDRPVPGQGMTAAPNSRVWEQPPQFAEPKEAISYVINKIDSREGAKDEMLNLMASGASVESIVNTISLSGFTEGKWSPDVAELIKMPITGYLVGLAMDNGIDATMYNVPPSEKDTTNVSDLNQVTANMRPEQYDKMLNDMEMAEEIPMEDEEQELTMDDVNQMMPQDQGGFMPRREIE
tara:strand:+ start:301 stop:870 length:570 start_codon:yes stop_codon:yes gene_type:complete